MSKKTSRGTVVEVTTSDSKAIDHWGIFAVQRYLADNPPFEDIYGPPNSLSRLLCICSELSLRDVLWYRTRFFNDGLPPIDYVNLCAEIRRNPLPDGAEEVQQNLALRQFLSLKRNSKGEYAQAHFFLR